MALVLIVDDHPPIATALAALVRSMRHQSAVVHRGDQALSFLRQRPADLVVLDVSMPGMSGLDVLRELRADPALRHVCVVIFSAYPEACKEAEALGADDCVEKPDVGRLSEVLERLLAGQCADAVASDVAVHP